MARSRFDSRARLSLRGDMVRVLQHTKAFLDCPLTDDQMIAIWHHGYPQDIRDAIALCRGHDFLAAETHLSSYTPTFAVPEHGFGMRWRLKAPERRAFLKWPRGARKTTTHIPFLSIVEWSAFTSHLSEPEQRTVLDWADAADQCTQKHNEARETIDSICKMISTPGQLRRMVPDLVGYLSESAQEAIMEQKRNSPYPSEWASYPKDRVERLIAALAEGHLVRGINTRDVESGTHSWARRPPK